MKSKTNKKEGEIFAEKVRKYLRKGKKGHLREFYNEAAEIINDKIEENEKAIKKINKDYGKLSKAEEAKKNFVFDIDTDLLSDPERRGDYAQYYVNQLLAYDAKHIDPLKKEIEIREKKIEKLKEALEYLRSVQPDVEEEIDNEEE